ncbi:MAG: hypothetical protein ACXVJG_16130 [Mucilaginibacter sp.]
MNKRSPKARKTAGAEDSYKSGVGSQKPEDRARSQEARARKRGKPEVGSPKSDEVKSERKKVKRVLKLDTEQPAQETPHSAPNEELPTANLKLQTENMEVHHHPEVEKKGFKEYILEGLMIFLAVMMGFFAESLREHITENDRAREYAATLYDDLKLDTAELHEYVAYFKNAKGNVDTLMQMLAVADPQQVPSGKLYWFGLYGGAYRIFTPHDVTFQEMKSSGSLRFFGDKIINRKLALYDESSQNITRTEAYEAGIYTEVRKVRALLFEYQYNDVINNISHIKNEKIFRFKVDSFKKTNPPVLSYNKTLFNQYVELVRSRFFERKVSGAEGLLRQANELIDRLNKKYGLSDE